MVLGNVVTKEKVMAEGSRKAKEISLGEDFGDVVVKVNGATVEVHAEGSVDAYTSGPVQVHPAANDDAQPEAAPQIGDLDDGGIYVSLSASDGKPLHAALKDLPDYETYEEALAAAEQLKSEHPTAHVPTPKELDKNLFDNRNTGHLKGTFNTSGSFPASVYRSSAPCFNGKARVQWFVDGGRDTNDRDHQLPVRLGW
jgi:hypothetical protein